MSEPWVGALKGQFEAIEARLGTASQPADREALKRDIIALFKRVDTALGDLQIKEEIRGLVERYKEVSAAPARRPRGIPGQEPPLHHDHLGASTYIEKGWSLISLGDPPGAIQALEGALELSPGDPQAPRCSAGPRCWTSSTTTRWARFRGC